MDRAPYAGGDGRVDTRAEAFITRELVNEIDQRYRTLATPDRRAIAGLSIGGFGAMLLGLRHPDRFGAIGAFSAPLDGIADPAAAPDAGPPPRLFIACGLADSLLPSSRRFAGRLRDRRVDYRYEEGPGGHTWEAWDWQLRSFLEMLDWQG
jgi:putative tributyrin esterase